MTLKEIADALGLEVYSEGGGLGAEVKGGYVSDLLSDVMGFAREGELWVTLQTHRNITGIASLKDLAGIVIVKGFKPDGETIAVAVEEGIAILGTQMGTFEFTGKLYELLNK